jgi:RNA polymerase sigma-70 factor (ECF subfamily)
VRTPEELQRFERLVMPHLGAGYNLARWLARNDHDADDIVQEAYLRAVRSFDRFRGGDPRAWILTIVRNTCYSWLEKNRTPGATSSGDADEAVAALAADASTQPEVQVLREADRHLVRDALDSLPAEFREVLLLREVESFSYKEIADIIDAPLGTVMSRLARARARLQQCLVERTRGEE